MTAISSAYEPKYPEKWDSEHFFFKCPNPIADTQNVTAVMTALNSNVEKIFNVLKLEQYNKTGRLSVPNLGEFQISATGENLSELADRIDNLLGEGFICFIEPLHRGRATTYVTFDTIELKLWQMPKLDLLKRPNQPLGQFNFHLIPMKV